MRKLIPIAVLACVMAVLASLNLPVGATDDLFFSSPSYLPIVMRNSPAGMQNLYLPIIIKGYSH